MTDEPTDLRVYTIGPQVGFADGLVDGLFRLHGRDPLTLARITLFLPSRRAVRAVGSAFLRASAGAAILLPRMLALGDLDEEDTDPLADPLIGDDLPPAADPLARHLHLTQALATALADQGHVDPWRRAVRQAADLARLLDQLAVEDVPLTALRAAVLDALPLHWQHGFETLTTVLGGWHDACAREGCMDATLRRQALLQAQAARWRTAPPAGPVIAAGSTGTIKASRALLRAIAGAPQGAVVLPGLDQTLDETAWQALAPSHPQHALKELLATFSLPREAVRPWPMRLVSDCPDARIDAVRTALLPPAATAAWAGRRLAAGDLAGVRMIAAATSTEEARVIALAMRETLETPGRTAALVTPDRLLARRVAALLARYGVVVDDSAGVPLGESPAGIFVRLLVRAAAESFAPLPFLSLVKHPLAQVGESRLQHLEAVRWLDRFCLRGDRQAVDLATMLEAASRAPPMVRAWLDAFAAQAAPLAAQMKAERSALSGLLATLVAAAIGLSGGEQGRLRATSDGALAIEQLEALQLQARQYPGIPVSTLAGLVDETFQGAVVRKPFGQHPRLSIWGPIEARLQRADLMILGGLNEGTWPPEPDIDPWLSPALRRTLGMAPLNRRVGQAAHDFAQALGAGEVLITRAERSGGQPAVASRLWQRLVAIAGSPLQDPQRLRDLARRIDAPDMARPAPPPRPRPPLRLRPRTLSISRVERLVQSPFDVYAARVLRLEPLDPFRFDPDARDKGNVFHKALELFFDPAKALPRTLPALLSCAEEAFAPLRHWPLARALWWPRFNHVAKELVASHAAAPVVAVESEGVWTLSLDGAEILIRGRADRIDRRPDGMAIVDYKTGAPYVAWKINQGYYPQLALLALMLEAGAFASVPAARVTALEYWHVGGGRADPLDIKPAPTANANKSVEDFIAETRTRLFDLLRAYCLGDTPFLFRPHPDFAPPSDYEQLARYAEWGALA